MFSFFECIFRNSYLMLCEFALLYVPLSIAVLLVHQRGVAREKGGDGAVEEVSTSLPV